MTYESDIPEFLAAAAFNGTSFSPERRAASTRTEYAQTLAADLETLRQHATKGGTLDMLDDEFSRYRAGMRRRYTAWLSSESRCVSSFIAGPSNFPARRMQKRNDVAHKRMGEYLNFREIAMKAAIRNLRPDLRPIMSGDADAVERLRAEIAQAETLQQRMKDANATIRRHAKHGKPAQIVALLGIGCTEQQANQLLERDFMGRIGFADFQLTNNSANIRRMKARLEQISAAKATPDKVIERDGIRIEDCPAENRVRLFFPDKPAADVRDALKRNGFRWAPSTGAWQAYRNHRAMEHAASLVGMVAR